MNIVLGADKSGFALKEYLKPILSGWGHNVIEIGTVNPEIGIPFFKVAPEAASLLQGGQADRAVLICGTGMGMSQVANKYKGVYAACVEGVYAARMCRAINDSNVLCMGGWIIAPELAAEITRVFLETRHTEGLEPWRQEFLKKAKSEFMALEETIYDN